MAKEGDLWDDSALINAFNDAISTYKMMHGKGQQDSSTEGGKVTSSTKENLSALVGGSNEPRRYIKADDNSNAEANTTTEMVETCNLPPVKENSYVNSCASQHYVDSSNCQQSQDALHGYSNTQGADNYTQLLNQYYELEEQKQKILQQLNQSGNWNYQSSGSNVHWGACSSQEHQVLTTQTSYPSIVCSFCPYACQCLMAPCSLCGTCVDKARNATSVIGCDGKSFSLEDGGIVKTAMSAAEKALSSLKTYNPEKKEEINGGQLTQSTGSETDLTVVLNAWYSAGFYTGKIGWEVRSFIPFNHFNYFMGDLIESTTDEMADT